MIGRKGPFGRMIDVLRPADGRSDEQVMQAWISPARPRWDHRPVSVEDQPFRIVRLATANDYDIHAIDRYEHLGVAMTNFVLRHLPAPGQRCMLIDRHEFALLGWFDCYDPTIAPTPEERYAWFGCQAAFEMLAVIHHHPVEVAFWERLATPEEYQ